MPQSIYDPGFAAFGGGSTHTVLHPLVIGAIIVVALLTFLLPRKYVIVPLFLGMMLIPSAQNLYVAGNHLYVTRILILFGLTRLIWTKISSPGNLIPGGFSTLDKLFVVWALYHALAVPLHFMQWGAVPNDISSLWAAIGGYFLFRCLIQNDEDVLRVLKVLAVVAFVAAAGMIFEQITRQNMFAFLGGIRAAPEIRNGRIRSQGMFAHSLLAGSFGAMMFPLFFWVWKRGKSWFFAILGAASSIVMVFTASCSTPLMALMGGGLVLFLWPIRKYMRFLRWGIVIVLAGLQLVMKAPVWFILQHLDLTNGSSGWERANLIDNFIRHFSSWWLIGTHDNVNWSYDMWDLANQFVAEGVTGGLVCFIAFIAMIVLCFRMIGNARKAVEGDKRQEWLFWFFGAALFAQVMAYFGISYYDQTIFVWYSLLVMISVVTLKPSAATAPVPDASPYPVPVLGVRRPATAGAGSETRSYAPVSKGLPR